MSRRQVIVLVVVALIIVVGIVVGILSRGDGSSTVPEEGKEGVEIVAPGADGEELPVFASEIPANTELTEPAEQSVAAPGAEEKFGAFNMVVSVAGFVPDEIVVTKGDVVQIRLTATGGDYDFSMPYKGLYVLVPEGEMKQITFGINTAGTYGFMCRDYCPDKTITGQLIVLP